MYTKFKLNLLLCIMCNCKITNKARNIISAERTQNEFFRRERTPVFGSGIGILRPESILKTFYYLYLDIL